MMLKAQQALKVRRVLRALKAQQAQQAQQALKVRKVRLALKVRLVTTVHFMTPQPRPPLCQTPNI